jgi:hypothetical protein
MVAVMWGQQKASGMRCAMSARNAAAGNGDVVHPTWAIDRDAPPATGMRWASGGCSIQGMVAV